MEVVSSNLTGTIIVCYYRSNMTDSESVEGGAVPSQTIKDEVIITMV